MMSQFLVHLILLIQSQSKQCSIGIEMFDSIPQNDSNPRGYAFRTPLTKAAAEHGAVCLDGSVPDIYIRPGIEANKWNIMLMSGGWCTGINETIIPPPSKIDTCYHRAKYGNGNSWNNKPYARIFGEWMDINATINPLYHSWNAVTILYCDGGSFTGNNESVYNESGIVLYFRGHRILKGAMDLLWDEYNMKEATDLVVGGCSAGGLATYLHTNWIYNEYVLKAKANINFMAVVDSGFFLEYEGLGKFVTSMQWLYEWGNVSADSANYACFEYYTKVNDQYLCMFAQHNVALIDDRIKMISFQSQYDLWQVQYELVDYENNSVAVDAYGANLTYYYVKNYINSSQNHTGFLDSCFHQLHIYI